MTDLKNDANALRWMAQWKHAAQELPKIKARELRQLTDADCMGLLGQSNEDVVSPYSCGLIQQQAWFSRLRISQLLKQIEN